MLVGASAGGDLCADDGLRDRMGARQSGRALQDFTEALAPEMQIAHDQRRPALGEDLGATGDGTVLAIRTSGRARVLRERLGRPTSKSEV